MLGGSYLGTITVMDVGDSALLWIVRAHPPLNAELLMFLILLCLSLDH